MMKKYFLFGAVIFTVIFLSSCQLMENFTIINASENVIEVEYSVKDPVMMPHGKFLPEIKSLADRKGWFNQKEWKKMSSSQYTFDAGERKFRMKLNPKEEMIIDRTDSYYIEKDGEKAIGLKNLKIKDNGKEIYFVNSKSILEEFKKNDFQIIYK